MRRKRAAPFRDKLWKEIGFARRDKFLHLFFRNGAMQNRFADAKCAFFGGCCGPLADKGIFELINLSFLTNRTDADRFVLGRVDLLRRATSVRTKIEFWFKIFAQFYGGVEWTAHFAAKSLQRANSSLGQKFFYFRSLEKPARHRFPNDQSTRSTFERSIIFVERTPTAFWTPYLERLQISADTFPFEILCFFDDLASELPDVPHELLTFHGAFLHQV